MGLSSVMNTAITGLNAAETTIDVTGNNVANANTDGFKSSTADFGTQFLQTMSTGGAPTASDGGTNPTQIGLGVQVIGVTPDFSQGTIQATSNPADLALQGNGFFITQSNAGQQLYTRDGQFQLNSVNQLVTATGNFVMGNGINQNYQIQNTTLQPLTIPLGSAAVAQATQNADFAGTLPPNGTLATQGTILQSAVLGDAAYSPPANSMTATSAVVPDAAGVTLTQSNGAGNLATGDTYSYEVVFGDGPPGSANPTQGMPSQSIGPISITAGNNQVTLNSLPTDPTGQYTTRYIYRTDSSGTGAYHLVGTVNNNLANQSFTDGANNATWAAGQTVNTNSLTGDYSYYVVFANASGGPPNGLESRPSQIAGPVSVSNQDVQLTNIPSDASGQWTVRRIYRSLASDPGQFYFVGEIPNNTANETFTDSTSDASILANPAAHPTIDLNGPTITTNTTLVNVLERNGNGGYDSPFTTGKLQFTGETGGAQINPPKTLTITNSTTVEDLINFMQQSLGIQQQTPSNGIPSDSGGQVPGGSIVNGQIQLVSDNGTTIAINPAEFTLTPTTGAVSQPNLNFATTQQSAGTNASANFTVYDSLGIPLQVNVTAVLQSLSSTSTTYRWYATSFDNAPASGFNTAVGTGTISFDSKGDLIPGSDATVSIERANLASSNPLTFALNFSNVSGLATSTTSTSEAGATLQVTEQDGQPAGKLSSYTIGQDGIITGNFDNGFQRNLGQIVLARFANPGGLVAQGQNNYAEGVDSGLPQRGVPGTNGIATITAGAVELSNTDVGENLIRLITASTQYQANAKVISSAQNLLTSLLNVLQNG